jgi:hypothetical protein
MTLRDGELKVQRKISAAFIAADPVIVILERHNRIGDGAGGFRSVTVPQPPQRFRLIPQEDGATARVTAEGETATPEFMLMGEYDCNMQRFDEFELNSTRFQVVYIDNRQYEIKGEVIRLGN